MSAVELSDDNPTDDDDDPRSDYPSLLTGPTLRVARLRAKKRLGDVARYLGLDSSVPPRWEGDRGSTRYKPLPGKYLEPLAQFFNCSVFDIAPQLREMDLPQRVRAGDLDEAELMLAGCGGLESSACASTTMTYTVAPTYVVGVLDQPSPPPGLPPEDMRRRGEWRLRCRGCGRVYVECLGARAPIDCECGRPLRARTRVSRVSGEREQRNAFTQQIAA